MNLKEMLQQPTKPIVGGHVHNDCDCGYSGWIREATMEKCWEKHRILHLQHAPLCSFALEGKVPRWFAKTKNYRSHSFPRTTWATIPEDSK